MKKQDIINAYCRIRTIDHTIPGDILDFMKDAAIEKLEEKETLLEIALVPIKKWTNEELDEFWKQHYTNC